MILKEGLKESDAYKILWVVLGSEKLFKDHLTFSLYILSSKCRMRHNVKQYI